MFLLQTHDFSELSTFNEYDMTDDDQSTLSTHTDHNHSLVCSGYTLEHPAMSTEDDHDSAISSRSADFQDQDRLDTGHLNGFSTAEGWHVSS